MTANEVQSVIDQMRAEGTSDEEILKIFTLMYQDGKFTTEQYAELVRFIGYEVTDDFMALPEEEKKKLVKKAEISVNTIRAYFKKCLSRTASYLKYGDMKKPCPTISFCVDTGEYFFLAYEDKELCTYSGCMTDYWDGKADVGAFLSLYELAQKGDKDFYILKGDEDERGQWYLVSLKQKGVFGL